MAVRGTTLHSSRCPNLRSHLRPQLLWGRHCSHRSPTRIHKRQSLGNGIRFPKRKSLVGPYPEFLTYAAFALGSYRHLYIFVSRKALIRVTAATISPRAG